MKKLKKGNLFLIPSVLIQNTEASTLTNNTLKHIKNINIFIVENIKNSRRFIKKLYKEKDLEKTIFYDYGKHNKLNLNKHFLQNILNGEDIGLLSDAGTPCIADPGSKIVEIAHENNINVIPIVGPSSIFLALMASGMNGQNFAFNGYLPVNSTELKKAIKKFDYLSKNKKQTQIFIETPFRNQKLFSALLQNCNKNTKLCIASNITATNEEVKTKKIFEWIKEQKILKKEPTIFIIESK